MNRKKLYIYISLIAALAISLTMLPLQFIGAQGCEPVINEPGFTADGNLMPKSGSAYILCINGDATKEYLIQYAGDLSPDDLEDDHTPLWLISSTVSSADLNAYYDNRGTPEPFLTYLKKAAVGLEPFAYINGATEKLVDGARYAIQKIDTDMAIPGDYPTGTYTVQGLVDKEGGCAATVTYTIIISRCLPGAAIEPVWVRTLPMTCSTVWVNEDGCFEFVFFWEYKNNNWVKIYDMEGNEVFSIDMPYGNPRFEACLDDGIYTVKTFHNDIENPIQEFVIGKP